MQSAPITTAIGYRFRDDALLRQALTHRSHGAAHNERLEFLGDSVLNFIIAAELYQLFGQLQEGELSRLRANLVNQRRLHEIALKIELGPQLRLGEGEIKSGGMSRPSILADAIEAVIGAAFVDGGFDAARSVVLRLFGELLAVTDPSTQGKDGKTLLQELLQARRMALPKYSVISTEGEAHEQIFKVDCVINELDIRTEGTGASRRSAEQVAALRAYELANAR